MKKNRISKLINIVKRPGAIRKISSENGEVIKIVEYRKEYRYKTYNHLINVCVNEYGFEEWKIDFDKFLFEDYQTQGGNLWVAVNTNDDVVGTIAFRNESNDAAEMKCFYVQKEYRGFGIAQQLFDVCFGFVECNGYRKMVLSTFEKFNRAIGFYIKNYFTEVYRDEDKLKYERIIANNEDVIGEKGISQEDALKCVV